MVRRWAWLISTCMRSELNVWDTASVGHLKPTQHTNLVSRLRMTVPVTLPYIPIFLLTGSASCCVFVAQRQRLDFRTELLSSAFKAQVQPEEMHC